MHRRSICQRRVPTLIHQRCLRCTYPVLVTVSSDYPSLTGRLSTCYSPVRHWAPKCSVRLACIRHAASVHPEPGSNSPFDLTLYVLRFRVSLRLVFFNLFVIFELTFLVQFSKIEFRISSSLAWCPFILPLPFSRVNIFFYFFYLFLLFFLLPFSFSLCTRFHFGVCIILSTFV